MVFCCGQPRTAHDHLDGKAPRSKRRAGRRTASANSHAHGHASENGLAHDSVRSPSELEDFMSCRDDFSVTDGSVMGDFHSCPASPRHTSTGNAMLPGSAVVHPQGAPSSPFSIAQQPGIEGEDLQGTSETESELGPNEAGPFAGCLHILDTLTSSKPAQQPASHRYSKRAIPDESKPEAGASMSERDKSQSSLDVSGCWEDAYASKYRIRGTDYMRTKVKIGSEDALYQCVATDIYATPRKQNHVARLVHLPRTSGPGVVSGDVVIPPLLIFNLQLPLYPAALFGPYDGEGVSIIFYFRLRPDFDPATYANPNALALFKRFITNSREADGTPTRDRLKLIPRVVNVEEWVQKGPLSQAEHKLLTNYNDKPILSRPQHTFYTGRGYLEVDLDLHQYTYLARRAITTYLARLPCVVWENAFVVQGNAPDELPEQILGIGRIYRFDFTKAKPLPRPARVSTSDGAIHPAAADGPAAQ